MADDSETREVKARVEENRFRLLKNAFNAGEIKVLVDSRCHNTAHSPAYSSGENIGPVLGLVVLSLAVLVLKGVAFGTLMLVLSTLIYAFALKPWIASRVEERVVITLMDNLHDFKLLWSFGGVALSLTNQPGTGCAAPIGDWRQFVRNNITAPESIAKPTFEENPLSPTRGEKN